MRKVGLIALGLGAFLLVLAPLLRFYAYPKLAKVPLDQYSTSVSQGTNMEAFYIGELETKSGLTLTSTRFVKADQAAQEEQGGNVAIWDSFVRSTDAEGTVLSATMQRVALDRTTAASVACCDTYTSATEVPEDRQPIEYQGLVFKFPMNTEKKTYDWWDSTLLATAPATFVRTENLFDTETYVFEQAIPPTTTQTQDIPGSLVGEEGTVSADRVYENKRTLWVEPNTGIVVKGEENLNTRFQVDGVDQVTLQKGVIGFDEATVKANAEDAGSKGSSLKMVRSTLPVTLGILGLLSLVGGFLLRRGDDPAEAGPAPGAPTGTRGTASTSPTSRSSALPDPRSGVPDSSATTATLPRTGEAPPTRRPDDTGGRPRV